MVDLKKLLEKREEILKTELFMFLHDVGKLHPHHQGKFLKKERFKDYKHDKHILKLAPSNFETWVFELKIDYTATLASIIEKHHGKVTQKDDGITAVYSQRIDRLDSSWDRDWIISPPNYDLLKTVQSPQVLIDSFAGFSKYVYRRKENLLICIIPSRKADINLLQIALDDTLHAIELAHSNNLLHTYQSRNILFQFFRLAMQIACGDTRLSVNDITLWDHSISTAILFKSLASWSVLLNPDLNNKRKFPSSDDKKFTRWFHPQLLPLRIDGLRYLSASNNIPDLLGRRKLLTKIYDELQNILEWEFPLAGEVYRDENGPVFLTFLRDENGQGKVPLSQLYLPKDSPSNPQTEHILPGAYKKAITLEECIRQAVIELSQGDLTLPPEISLVTYTQKRTDTQEEKSLGELLADEQKEGLWLQADVSVIQNAWKNSAKENVCSVCGLRPLGFGATDEKERKKAISRKMCGVCLKRRADRAKSWAQGIEKSSEERFQNGHPGTVWLDEVADTNGRLALIVGYFPLEHWLDGTLVRSLSMFKRDAAQNEPVNHQISVLDDQGKSVDVILGPKPVSYSRIRRIWETTRRFWQDVAPTDVPPEELQNFCQQNNLALDYLWEGPLSLKDSLAGKIVGEAGPRLKIEGIPDQILKNGKLGKYHAYELVLPNNVKIAVLWDPPNKRLITVENLVYIARNLGWNIPKRQENESKEDYESRLHKEAADFVRNALHDKTISLNIPPEYGAKSETITTFKAQVSEISDSFYTPLIPILAEPRTFMAIVPADRAFEIVKAIKAKYEREMGKVRNRLPLHIGVVFAYRKMPLRAIMDAGRRMLEQKWKDMVWEIVPDDGDYGFLSGGKEITTDKDLDENVLENEYKEIKDDQFKKWHRIVLRQKVQPSYQQTKKEMFRYVVWYVPTVMGDGETDDYWYPYVFLAQEDEPKDREIYYKTDMVNPWNPDHPWLVHVSKLAKGDKIYFTPATFDFEFLDFNARRFEIAYDEDGKRKNSLAKPYLLDEIRILEQIWEFITGKDKPNGKPRLSTTQMFALREMIETKREGWFDDPEDSLSDPNFRAFCNDLFINAEWQWGKPDDKKLKWLTEMAVQGYFTDAIYLFHHIMKQDIEVGNND